MEAIARNPADLFAGLIERLGKALTAGALKGRLAGPLLMLIWNRLSRLRRRFAALVARVQAGRLPPARPRPAFAEAKPPGLRADGPAPAPRPPSLLPRGVGWLTRLVPEVCTSGGELCWLLQQPEMAALVGAAPQAGRILRPLCRMLGVELPRELRLRRHPPPPLVCFAAQAPASGEGAVAAAGPAAEAAERPGPPPVGPVLTWDNPKPYRPPAGGVTRCDPPPEREERPWIRSVPYSQRQ